MSIIRSQYWNFVLSQKHKKFSYSNNFDRVWRLNELILNFPAPIKYAKAQFSPLIKSIFIVFTDTGQTDTRKTRLF